MSDVQTNSMIPILGNRTYNVLKWIAQILLPALGTLYYTLAGIWDLPNADEVVGTIMAVDLFLGLLLGLSSNQYQKSGAWADGTMEIEEKPTGAKTMSLDLNVDPEEFEEKDRVVFKVDKRQIDGLQD